MILGNEECYGSHIAISNENPTINIQAASSQMLKENDPSSPQSSEIPKKKLAVQSKPSIATLVCFVSF